MMKRKTVFRWVNRLTDCLLWGAACIVLWVVMQVFVFSSYRIPSDSMEPTLWPGDYIWVDKTSMGARLFSLKDAAAHRPFKVHRTWGRSRLKVGEVAVFNYPYPQTRDSIGFDLMQYYVKRCMGTPGDSLQIVGGYYKINGNRVTGLPEPVKRKQDSLHYVFTRGEKKIRGVSIRAFPKKKEMGWTIVDYGPLYIPKKGDLLKVDRKHFLCYRTLIEWEQGKKLEWKDGKACLDGKILTAYRFEHDYYFMGGDNVFSSVDSRYWGLLPDDFIAGKVCGIWKSEDLYTRKIRWNRIGFID